MLLQKEKMSKNKALLLAGLTLWPYLFLLFGWLLDLSGLLASTGSQPPVAFILFLLVMALTALLVPALVIFYLVYLLTRPALSLDRKLVWAALLVIGHVLIMPLFWYLFLWKPHEFPPMKAASRFSLLVFAPLLLVLLLPLALLLPMLLIDTLFYTTGLGYDDLAGMARGWAWVVGPILGATLIYLIGRSCYRWCNPPHLTRLAWVLLWAMFSLLSLPVAWFGTLVTRAMLPTDAPPFTPAGLAGVALILALFAQPLVIAWLYIVSHILRRVDFTAPEPTSWEIASPGSLE